MVVLLGTPGRPGDFQKIYVTFSYVPFCSLISSPLRALRSPYGALFSCPIVGQGPRV